MGKYLLLITILFELTANAQPYLISFAGTGASTTAGSVKVDNLTSGTSLTVTGSDILRLTTVTGINYIENSQSTEMKIYPNPMIDNSTLQIYVPVAGDMIIGVHDMTGKLVAQNQSYVENGQQEYRLSGLNSGLYLVSVKGNSYQYSGKLLSKNISNGTTSIRKVRSNIQALDEKTSMINSKGVQTTVDMIYTAGDRIKFTGISGIYSTIITDIPTVDKTITFTFIACTDGDNNNYPIIKIGNQVWMAENLKTTKFKNGTAPILNETVNEVWRTLLTPAFCWCNNNEAEYKATYGALYNWYAASSGNLCPAGWHVPADAEWTTLTNYLTQNGYGYPGGADQIAKSMAATWGWTTYAQAGTPGNDQLSNNSSGFTALPAGYRADGGVFVLHGLHGFFWSSEEFWSGEARGLGVTYFNTTVFRDRFYNHYGFSVRCIKDD
jgi:uncharacterized protein (TIGR02145 family)